MCFKLDTIKKNIRISRLVKPYAFAWTLEPMISKALMRLR